MAKKTAVLIILDGWGIGETNESNPLFMTKPPTFEWLAANYPVTSLQASGISVGLPWGEIGNSEVGHLTLGAGKVLYQYYPRITMSIQDGTFFDNAVIKAAAAHARENNSAVNLVGLLTKGNVHASIDHLKALIRAMQSEQITKINLHLFADAKDSAPHSVEELLSELPKEYLASMIGRYYGMDRNGGWRLTETAYQTMTGTFGQVMADPTPLIEDTYKAGSTEEYLPGIRFTEDKNIKDGDSVIFFNYREDSIRQIASAFLKKDFAEFSTIPFKNLYIATMTHYDDIFDVPVIFPPDNVANPFGKVISDLGMTQLRIAETYKYAHVTYFFNGLREPPFQGEYRTLVPSNVTPHPEDRPEMMASAITDRLIEALQTGGFDFILVNYANADTIAHTANYNAAIEAIKVLDAQIARIIKLIENPDIVLFITSDHGNIERMIDERTGEPESQHDASPVPFYLVGQGYQGKKFVNGGANPLETLGSLADVAPTMLQIMGIPRPDDMSGSSLLDGLM